MSTTVNNLVSFCLPDNRVTFFRPISKTKPTSGAVADESPWPASRMKRGGGRIWFLNRPDLWPNIEYGMIYESRRPLVNMGSAKSGSFSSETLTESLRSLLFEGLETVDHMTCHFEVQTV
jgi:hypothetical protein